MAKPRVHEIAKELGIPSKEAVAKLQELGEFVKGASSTLEPPVVKKLRAAFPNAGASAEAPAAEKKAATPASAPKPGASAPKPGASAPKPGAPAPKPATPAAPAAPKPAAEAAPAAEKKEAAAKPAGPRPGNNPFSTTQGMSAPKPAAPKP
ncbi:translation initiation factor IF-2 N-terminal domain-containing protein, partial [Rothia nasimurium]|uniref:translation initiation factor IF-2 N-terminal domain-containing protein n=1 Tax=Rothia nasimurium TaxID=85336 RepID=UPI001F3EC087